MKNKDIKTGEVFLAHNKYMHNPKNKFHICINEKMYLLINSKPSTFNCEITIEECTFLTHKSYINCTVIRTEPIKEFNIIKKEELPLAVIERIIKKIEVVPTISPIQKKQALKDLKECLTMLQRNVKKV